MLVNAAESRFRRGREALDEGRGLEALALFEAALELERRHGAIRPQARYLSFYGLTLALEGGRIREGLGFCKRAIPEEFYNPELYWNYGRVLMAAGRKKEAHDVLRKGQILQPSHAGIAKDLDKLGRRRRPMIPFLSRSHPFNVALGRLVRPPTVVTAESQPAMGKHAAR